MQTQHIIIGAIVAIISGLISSFITYRYTVAQQKRKLKEERYLAFIEACCQCVYEHKRRDDAFKKYTHERNKLIFLADAKVVKKVLEFDTAMQNDNHDQVLNELIQSIRKDIGLNTRQFPFVSLKSNDPKIVNQSR